jgi:hypothetical protein
MPLLTVEQLREHIKTTLPDDAVQRLLDANEAEIVERYGSSTTAATYVFYPYNVSLIALPRAASAVTSVLEDRDDTETPLPIANYRLTQGGRTLERRSTLTDLYTTWGGRVAVTYSIADEVAKRRRVLVRITQYDIENRPGVGSQSTADQSISYSSRLDDEREEIFRSLDSWRGPVFA